MKWAQRAPHGRFQLVTRQHGIRQHNTQAAVLVLQALALQKLIHSGRTCRPSAQSGQVGASLACAAKGARCPCGKLLFASCTLGHASHRPASTPLQQLLPLAFALAPAPAHRQTRAVSHTGPKRRAAQSSQAPGSGGSSARAACAPPGLQAGFGESGWKATPSLPSGAGGAKHTASDSRAPAGTVAACAGPPACKFFTCNPVRRQPHHAPASTALLTAGRCGCQGQQQQVEGRLSSSCLDSKGRLASWRANLLQEQGKLRHSLGSPLQPYGLQQQAGRHAQEH